MRAQWSRARPRTLPAVARLLSLCVARIRAREHDCCMRDPGAGAARRAPHHGPLSRERRGPPFFRHAPNRCPTSSCPPPPKAEGERRRHRLLSLSAPGGGEGRGEVGVSSLSLGMPRPWQGRRAPCTAPSSRRATGPALSPSSRGRRPRCAGRSCRSARESCPWDRRRRTRRACRPCASGWAA